MNNNTISAIFTIFQDYNAFQLQQYEWTWDEFCKKVESPKIYPTKEHMPLIKMASFGDIRSEGKSLRNNANIIEVYGIEGDYDAGLVSIQEAQARLEKHGIEALLYTSPSWKEDFPKWRVICPFSAAKEPEERELHLAMLNTALGGILAPESFTLSQSYFIGRTDAPYQVIRVHGEYIDFKVNDWQPTYKASKTIIVNETGEVIRSKLDLTKLVSNILNGEQWHDSLRDLACHYVATGVKRNSAIEILEGMMNVITVRDQRWTDRFNDIPNLVNSAYAAFGLQEFKQEIGVVVNSDPELLPDFIIDKNGKIDKTQGNLLKLLSQYDLRYDNFRAASMITIDETTRPVEDEDYTRIQYIAEKMGFKAMPKEMIRDNVHMLCMNHPYDSAIEWGKSLQWDGIERCKHLLHTYFGAEENAYTTAASMYITTAMGGRLMVAGIKADAAIVLVGEQGVGKTMAIQALSPFDDNFVEISLQTRDADLSRHLRGKLIGELAELSGLQTKEAEDIKAWMSRTTEEWTPKYMEFTKTFKRRLTLWGSTNNYEFLSDHTGNRRWLPIVVKTPQAHLIKKDCLQIWAEAIYLFEKHGVLWEEAQKLADPVRETFFSEDPLHESVVEYLVQNAHFSKFKGQEIWTSINPFKEFDKKAQNQIGRIMTKLGYKNKSIRQQVKVGDAIQSRVTRMFTKD